ncbi:hypothetical protein GF385_04515 [Candidatus Dependentiae bacterium]|nr:hypothetical protein [Candidatus Dependentiae bacterium]
MMKKFFYFCITLLLFNELNCMNSDVYRSFDYENGNPYSMQLLADNQEVAFARGLELGWYDAETENRAGITSLMLAASKGYLLAVKAICVRADINFIIKKSGGLSARDHAIMNGHQEIVDYFDSAELEFWGVVWD